MSSQLKVSEAIELVESLRGALREFAASEESLEKDFRARTAGVQKRHEDALQAQDEQLAADLSQAEAAFQTARDALQRKYERRKARLGRALKSANKTALERIDNEEGRVKYTSQKGLLDTERNHKESLAQNDTALAEYNARLAENRETFVALENDARRAFRDYGKFRKRLTNPGKIPEPDLTPDEHQLLERLQQLHGKTAAELKQFRRILLPAVFRNFPLYLWIVIILVGSTFFLPKSLGPYTNTPFYVGVIDCVALVLVIALHFLGGRKGAPLANSIADSLEIARRKHNACLEKAQARHAQEITRIETEAKERTRRHNQNWQTALEEAAARRESWPKLLEEKWRLASIRLDQFHHATLARREEEHATKLEQLRQTGAARKRQTVEAHEAKVRKFRTDHDALWQKLTADWKARVQPIYDALGAADAAADAAFPPWQPALWENWTPPATFLNAARVARLDVDAKKLAETMPRDARLALPGPANFSLPLILTYPGQGSVLFETTKSGNEPVIAALNNILFRLLATSPAGKLSITIIDPVKLGQNFAGVMHLADFEENIINGRIWTQAAQIEQRLADLNEHMEKVIQMYLRNEYETIAEYNAQAGNIAEKYHFVVIADFPANFTETAARRLLHIAASGARCGVYTLIHWDHRHTAPTDFFPEELRKSSVCINCSGEHFVLAHPLVPGTRVQLDAPPDTDLATAFLHRVGETSRGANRVEVPFEQVAPTEAERWTLETTEELRVPIGRSGATKLQQLAIGKGTRQHALIAGKTGSGKSTLFHVIITNLSLWCSPEQVEFYLVDFKKGVEFKGYATRRLPHARVVAIESDREFGLSVLQRVDEELKRRGDLFRQLGVQDIPGYKRAGGTEPMPRSLLLIDEFQELFVEDDKISQAAAVLLDRIVRQGRAFGIHVILGSQTLGGAYTLARTTIGQMVIRIALQCNEADAYLIMDENNAAPRLLSRPGEGIYNDMAGMVEGNSPFQAVWISDEQRDEHLAIVRALADRVDGGRLPGPIVFEGNAPADVRENHLLRALLEASSIQPTSTTHVWLGAPNSIKGPTEAIFEKRSGNNLLIVGQRDEAVLAMVALSLVSLSAQHAPGTARFIVFESTPPGSPERAVLERIVAIVPHDITLAKSGDLTEVLTQLSDDLKSRAEDEQAAASAPTTYLLLHGMQNFKKLRQDDDFSFSLDDSGGANPAVLMGKLVSDGASHGIHIIAALDTYNNVVRFLGRKALSEFEMRVLFQMSTNDSASLCDDPKASALGLHRALFYNEQEGYLETFRPYALPASDWVEATARNLVRLVRGTAK